MSTLYTIFSVIPFCVCMTWTVIFLLDYRVNDVARRTLTFFAAACAVLYFCHAENFLGGGAPWVDSLWMTFSLAAFPVFWLYIRNLTEESAVGVGDCWVLVPAAVIGFLSIFIEVDLVEKAIFLVEVVLVCVFGIRKLNDFDKRVNNIFSDTEGKSTRPVALLMYVVIFTSFCAAALNFIGRAFFVGNLVVIVPSVLFSGLLFGIFYIGSRLEYTAKEVRTEDLHQEEFHEDSLESRIDALMQTSRAFTKKGLKITDLSQMLATNRTYVSSCINNAKGKTFSEYINDLRLEYAKELMAAHPSMTMSEVADLAGFSGESSFYRNFKTATGTTPSKWLENRVN